MEKLTKTIEIKGIGKPGMKAYLVDRTDKKAWYRRDDNVHEVFKIDIAPEQEVFGRKYPERERYPSNEDFGRIAWCYTKQENAREQYNKI